MRPMTRATIALTAGALLIGGAGTLSYWTDESRTDGIQLVTGETTLSDFTCSSDWAFADGDPVVDGEQIVPGDVISKICSFEVTVEGDNAVAELTLVDKPDFLATSNGSFTAQLITSATYSIDGNPVPAQLTPTNDGDVVDTVISVMFEDLGDPAAALDTADPTQNQNVTNVAGLIADLDEITVVLTQTPLAG